MPDEVDVQRRAERALLDLPQTHLADHDPRLRRQRSNQLAGEWGPWHSPASHQVATDGGHDEH